MKKGLLVIFIVGFAQMLSAQDCSLKEDFEMKQYAKDTSAEAVVIYDIGKSYFTRMRGDFELMYERSTKIKILKKSGFKWAEISIPVYQDNNIYETVEDLQGKTYNLENGNTRVSILNPKNSYVDKRNKHWILKKFAMPDIKEGSVFEISYTVRSPYFFNLRSWDFQWKIPVMYSQYTAKMTPFWEYIYILQNTKKIDEFKNYVDDGIKTHVGNIAYNDVVYDFVMKDVPAFKDESFITSEDDYKIKLNFQLTAFHSPSGVNTNIISTWKKLSEELMDNEDFGTFLKNSRNIGKKIIDTMGVAEKPALEKAKVVENYVKSNFGWNKDCYNFTSESAKNFLKEKTGNSAEINLFLAGMLNAAGIEAYPVVLSTRDNGKIKMDYPFLHFFNYVIVAAKVDSSIILLDATEPLCDFGQIPSRCLNDKGLIVQKGKEEWIGLKSQMPSNVTYDFNLKLNAAGDSLLEDCKLASTGYDAIDYRNKFLNSYKDLKKDLQSPGTLNEDSLQAENLNQIEKPFEISYKNKGEVEAVEDKIVVSPFCDRAMTENPLKQAERTYPVDITYHRSRMFKSTIAVPKGYKLLKQPDNMNINNDLVSFQYVTAIMDGDIIKVSGLYDLKKDVYALADYAELKDCFDKIVDKFNEKLIFVKK